MEKWLVKETVKQTDNAVLSAVLEGNIKHWGFPAEGHCNGMKR